MSAQQWFKDFIKKWGKPHSVILPPKFGWGQNGQLRANGTISQAVQLTADFKGQIGTHTVQFDGFDSNLDIGPAPEWSPRPEAEILWSVNGVTCRRLVTVLDGQSVSGMAEGVVVNVRDRTTGGNGAVYNVGITVAPGVRANVQQPPTLRVDGIDGAGAVWPFGASVIAGDHIDWTLPANAGIISSYLTLTVAPALLLENVSIVYRANNLQVLRTADGNIRNLWSPIPQGTNSIRVTNNTANTINVSLTFGIEG